MSLADQLGSDAYAAYIRRQNRERQQRYRAAHGGKKRWLPFVGIDGEGGGTDRLGRQHFKLMRAGKAELFNDGWPLTTRECLEFILSLPKAAILVGYFFTYDATQILRDLPEERLRRLFRPTEPGRSPYTYWSGYAIEFRPKQYLRVARCRRDEQRMSVISGSARTINEVGGFFQKAFVSVIEDWRIGTKYGRDLIAENKAKRSSFEAIGDNERNYCRMEVKYLGKLMEAFRDACHEADAMPASWRGAGAIAAALHRNHKTPKRTELWRSARFEAMAATAYYGGRFEITRIGRTSGLVWEYDISSAYPDAMRRLPCPIHSKWQRFKVAPLASGLYIADVSFSHGAGAHLCGLPIRLNGHLFWPRQGRGIYWSCEIKAALEAGANIEQWHGGYQLREDRICTCHPYDWIETVYEARRQLGKATRGVPLKLGINGLYGKLAQRLGGAPYRDLVGAGLVTAMTRAKLIRAYTMLAPEDRDAIVMMATDSLFSTKRLPLDIGPKLGQWEESERPTGLFVVQPGIYWSPGSDKLPKTRGIPRSQIIAQRDLFEAYWDRWLAELPDGHNPHAARAPVLDVQVTNFIGHRLALSWGKPEQAGRWIEGDRQVAFDWSAKRADIGFRLYGHGVATEPHDGHAGLRSEAYDPSILTELEERNLEMEADDDYQPWGNSGE